MIRLIQGSSPEALRVLDDNSVDSIVTDPPYGLSFMGKKWDYDVPSVDVWRECLRVLKPGGYLLAFAGTRTQHRMAVRIEDAGFEIRDMIAWVYGSGFPKSLDVSKAIDRAAGAVREVVGKNPNSRPNMVRVDATVLSPRVDAPLTSPATDLARQWQGWGTALKPALEPITVARKPLIGTVAENVTTWGTGAINVDGGRVGTEPVTTQHTKRPCGDSVVGRGATSTGEKTANIGRFPANLIHDGSDEVVGLFPVTTSGGTPFSRAGMGFHGASGQQSVAGNKGDSGSAARFFACFPPEGRYSEPCQTPSNAPTVPSTLSLQSVFASTAQSAVAIWPHLEGTLSSEPKGASTAVTLTESKAISETAMQVIASIASGYLQGSQQERRTPCGSLVKAVAMAEPTGITRITISLLKSDGSAEAATFSITPTNLGHGEAASRFKYCAKASRSDREDGCAHLEAKTAGEVTGGREEGSPGIQSPRAGAGRRRDETHNHHPTVKPTDLMRYLCRLVTPPGGVILDPFMGSGSTGRGAVLEGFSFVGVEREADYLEIARARINAVAPEPDKPRPITSTGQLALF